MQKQTKQPIPRLKAWRIAKRLTQLQLALASDVGIQTVYRVEQGAPTKELTIARLAHGLGISVRSLMEDDPTENAA